MSQPPKFLLPAIATVLALGLIAFAIVMGLQANRTTPEECKAEIEQQFGLAIVRGEGNPDESASVKAALEEACRSQSTEEGERLLKEVAAQVLGNMFGGIGEEGEPAPAEGESYGDGGEPGMVATHPALEGDGDPNTYDEGEDYEEPIDYTPKKSDWKLTTKTLDKSCYGDGKGCQVEFRIKAEYNGTEPLPERGTVELTYTSRTRAPTRSAPSRSRPRRATTARLRSP